MECITTFEKAVTFKLFFTIHSQFNGTHHQEENTV